MVLPPVPICPTYESTSKPFVNLALLGHLPSPDSGVEYLQSAKKALDCSVLDLGLPRTGCNELCRRYKCLKRGCSPPLQNESLPCFALTAALMAVGASNIPPVRVHRTESIAKFGTVNHLESPSFLFALSQQALGVWMDGGQPVPAGVKGDQTFIKNMRADFLRACLVGIHYLMGAENVSSPNHICTKVRKYDTPGRQAVLSLLGRMVAALRSWGFAEGLLCSPLPSQVGERSKPTSASTTSSKSTNPLQGDGGNGKSVEIRLGDTGLISADQPDQELEGARSEAEESRIRILWDAYYYDLAPPDDDMQCTNNDADEDHEPPSKDQEKSNEETQDMRLEQTYLVHRALLTRIASTIKRSTTYSCCDQSLGQAVRMENLIAEWVDGLPSELRWAFKHGVGSSASGFVATGKAALGDESNALPADVEFYSENVGRQSRRRVLSCELAIVTQLLVLKIFSPFVSDHLAKGGPAPESRSCIAIALRHFRASAQAIIHVSRLMHGVWEMAAQSERSACHARSSLKPPLLKVYPLDQLLLDATLVCSRICCGPVPSEPGGEDLGMNRCDPCSSEIMLSIGMGLTLLEQLHGLSQHDDSSRNASLSTPHPSSDDMKLVRLVRKRWEVKNASLSSSELSKRDRATMEAEGLEGENGHAEPEVNMCPMEVVEVGSTFGEEQAIATSEPQRDGTGAGVDQTQYPHRDPAAVTTVGPFVISRARGLPNALATPSPALASSLSTLSARAKKGKGQQAHIRRRIEQPSRSKVGPTKQLPNPPTPLFTLLPRQSKSGGTLGSAEAFQKEVSIVRRASDISFANRMRVASEARYLPMVERPHYPPTIGMHPPSMPKLTLPDPELQFNDGATVNSGSLAHYNTSHSTSGITMDSAMATLNLRIPPLFHPPRPLDLLTLNPRRLQTPVTLHWMLIPLLPDITLRSRWQIILDQRAGTNRLNVYKRKHMNKIIHG
ncbi:hypothetical protein MD484_g7510, partial [Candolleomyces efflorescens]